MALNPSGVMSIGGTTVGASINLELNLSATANSNIGQANFRELAKVPTGQISLSDFYGKSNIIVIPPITTNTANLVITAYGIPGYVAGESKLELTINAGVYLYSTDVAQPALKFIDFVTGDQITVINNGFIMGMGGQGGRQDWQVTLQGNGQNGGTAISLSTATTIVNNSYIGGGGGGGAYGPGNQGASGGGGGAGGGKGGRGTNGLTVVLGGLGGAPGQIGVSGSSQSVVQNPSGDEPTTAAGGGGGGGRIFPGTSGAGGIITGNIYPGGAGTAYGGSGGGAGGGSGALYDNVDPIVYLFGKAGGSAGNVGTFGGFQSLGGGGGGWGASGGSAGSVQFGYSGGLGGKAIALNGKTATITGSGTVYGAVS